MRVDRVIFVWDGAQSYSSCWELVSRLYSEKLGVRPTLFFVSSGTPPRSSCGDVWQLPPLPEMVTPGRNVLPTLAFLWGPCRFPDEVCMTSGIDQIPLSGRFLESLADVPASELVIGFGGAPPYRDFESRFGCRYYPSSHLAGLGSAFQSVLRLPDRWEDAAREIWNSEYPTAWENRWGLDEAFFSHRLNESNAPHVVFPTPWFADWVARRLDRSAAWAVDESKLLSGWYSEMHMSHPPSTLELQIVNRLLST